jgi:hypothetical protein
MDAVTEFVKAIAERFRNPFVFSLTVALIFSNWEIPLALFWQDQTGTQTIRDFIAAHEYSIVWPIVFAIGYCFIVPAISQGFHLYQTYVNTEGNKKALDIAKKGKIDGEQYYEAVTELEVIKEKYVKGTMNYDTVERERDNYRKENDVQNKRIGELIAEVADTKKQYQKQIDDVTRDKDTRIDELKSNHVQQIDDLNKKYTRELANDRKTHVDAIAHIKQEGVNQATDGKEFVKKIADTGFKDISNNLALAVTAIANGKGFDAVVPLGNIEKEIALSKEEIRTYINGGTLKRLYTIEVAR